MEENRILDASRKALNALPLALLLCALFSSTLPRIAIVHDPLTPEEHVNLGVAYERKGELDAALEQYDAASKKLPAAYLYIGNVYFQKNDTKTQMISGIRSDNGETLQSEQGKMKDEPKKDSTGA